MSTNYVKFKTGSVVVVLFLLATSLQAKEWRGITPLKSTRADVERLLGSPNALGRYQFDEERAYIYYAKGCEKLDDCWCVAAKDTVTYIDVQMEVELRFSGLKIDRASYKKYTSRQNPNIVTYSNYKEGVGYTVDAKNDDVISIDYMPSTKDCKDLVRRRLRKKQIRGLLTKPMKSTGYTSRVPGNISLLSNL